MAASSVTKRAPEVWPPRSAALRRHPPRSLPFGWPPCWRCAEGPLRPPAPGAVPHLRGAGGAMSGLVVDGLSVEPREPARPRPRLARARARGDRRGHRARDGARKSSLRGGIPLPSRCGRRRGRSTGRALRDLAIAARRVFSFLPRRPSRRPRSACRRCSRTRRALRGGPPDGLAGPHCWNGSAWVRYAGSAGGGAVARGEAAGGALRAPRSRPAGPVLVLDEPFGVFDPLQLEDRARGTARARAAPRAGRKAHHPPASSTSTPRRDLSASTSGGRSAGEAVPGAARARSTASTSSSWSGVEDGRVARSSTSTGRPVASAARAAHPPLLPLDSSPRPRASERDQAEPFSSSGGREPVRPAGAPEALGVREQRRHADLGRRLGLLGQEGGRRARGSRGRGARVLRTSPRPAATGRKAEDRLEGASSSRPVRADDRRTISPGREPERDAVRGTAPPPRAPRSNPRPRGPLMAPSARPEGAELRQEQEVVRGLQHTAQHERAPVRRRSDRGRMPAKSGGSRRPDSGHVVSRSRPPCVPPAAPGPITYA